MINSLFTVTEPGLLLPAGLLRHFCVDVFWRQMSFLSCSFLLKYLKTYKVKEINEGAH